MIFATVSSSRSLGWNPDLPGYNGHAFGFSPYVPLPRMATYLLGTAPALLGHLVVFLAGTQWSLFITDSHHVHSVPPPISAMAWRE